MTLNGRHLTVLTSFGEPAKQRRAENRLNALPPARKMTPQAALRSKPLAGWSSGPGGRMRWSAITVLMLVISITKHQPCLAEGSFAFAQHSDGRLAWGATWDLQTMEEAKADALSDCEKLGGQGRCAVGAIFNRSCAALAVQKGFNVYSFRFATEKKIAEDEALNACRKLTQGKRCQIATSFCDRTKEKTLICAKPVFQELHNLRETMVREPSKAEFLTQATLYLLYKYCTTIDRDYADSRVLTKSRSEQINELCEMYTDTSNVEGPIYWEKCKSLR